MHNSSYRTKVRPGSLGLLPASLKLKRLLASKATWPTIMGVSPCLRTRRLSATVYVPLNCCGLPFGPRRGELPIAGQGQFDRGAVRAGRGPVAHEARHRMGTWPRFPGAAGWLDAAGSGSARRGNAAEQLGGQLVLGIQLHDFLKLYGGGIGIAASQVVFGQQEFRLRRGRVRFCVLLQGAELRRVDLHARIERASVVQSQPGPADSTA